MPTPTYDLIASNVLTSSASSVEFTSISGYRDLIIVSEFLALSGNTRQAVRINNNTSSIYSTVYMYGDGTSAASTSSSGDDRTIDGGSSSTTERAFYQWQFLDASATDKHKTILLRSGRAGSAVFASAARAATTTAITSIQLVGVNGSFAAGSSFYLYGIVS
jgi:hypothetical protein